MRSVVSGRGVRVFFPVVLLVSGVLLSVAPAAAQRQEVLEGRFVIKFTSAAKGKLKIQSSGSVTLTGLPAVDHLNHQFKVISMRRAFRPAGRHEARHVAWGLDGWYVVEFAGNAGMQGLLTAYAALSDVEAVEPVYRVRISGVPDDAHYGEQWHYHNTGQSGGTSDADIDLPEAHDVETGHPAVVVQVIDSGIEVGHEDLQGALWVNPGEVAGNGVDDDANGYVDDVHGYDFYADTGALSDPNGHGTHVAGTIGARANNGIGVAGVAGGNGTAGSGARVMTARFLDAAGYGSSNHAATALVYGADNGAVISSNSWSGGHTALLEDAIDYFIANAGTHHADFPAAPLAGGLVVFAAGNDASGAPSYPAYYPKTLAVAATGHDDVRAYYSNYGDWVDIAAPGGDQSGGIRRGVLSTVPGGYAFYQGTSMACPHVSGVAALVASYEYRNGTVLTADLLRTRLTSTTDYIDPLNPGFESLLGSGRLNARNALLNIVPFPPEIDIAPSGISLVLEEGASTTRALTIGNTGAGRLFWSAAVAPSAASEEAVLQEGEPYPAHFYDPPDKDAPDARAGQQVDETSSAADGGGYRWTSSDDPAGPAFDWFDIRSLGTALSLPDDGFQEVALPFRFLFYGTSHTTVNVSSNGYLTFGRDGASFGNAPIPSSEVPNDFVAPFWDDLNPAAGGKVHHYHDAARNRFIVQYTGVPRYYEGGALTFQVVLSPDGDILFQYHTMTGITDQGTIGIEDASGSNGLEIAFNTAFVSNGLAVLVDAPWLIISPASGEVVPGGSQTATLHIDTEDLAAGSHTGTITITSNDPDESSIKIAVDLTVGSTSIGEAGSLTVSQSGAGQWHSVAFSRSYANPVVVMGPLSFHGSQPATLRVRGVTSTGFQFQIDEWDYMDGRHYAETAGYLVVEAGTHQLADGRLIQAGRTSATSGTKTVSFPERFAAGPVVLSQVVTVNDAKAVVTRQKDVTAGGFALSLQSQEASATHQTETVAWIALASGRGTNAGKPYEIAVSPDAVTHTWYGLTFSQNFTQTPVLLAAMQRTDGRDSATLRYRSLSGKGVEVKVEEETSLDAEVIHTTESVGYVLLPSGPIAGTTGTPLLGVVADPDAAVAAREVLAETGLQPGRSATYRLDGNYPNPFNPQTTIRYALPEQVHVRLEVFDVLGRRVALLVDAVQEGGSHEAAFDAAQLPGGMYLYRIRAGAFEQTHRMLLLK